ncbi:hypothetical protein [Serratia silvae]|uniref:Uncharacterized protein n=1 Tax=Serratia silvae TaxID=2824122 RepID=A0ABT0K9F5_9GAMM|nr:hypothetical protein [Serratia silvae]MCL1028653.1 hypothetical protein [Serratia silvae]
MIEISAENGGFMRSWRLGCWAGGVKIRSMALATARNHILTNVKLVTNHAVTKLRCGGFFALFLSILVVG